LSQKNTRRNKLKSIKFPILFLSIVVLTLVLFTGCGVAQSDYDALQTQKTALETEKQTLQNENKALKSERDAAEAEAQTLKADNDKLNADYSALQSELSALQDEKDSLSSDYNIVNNELTEIKKVYPPRDFTSRRELEEWLYANDVSEKPAVTGAEAWIGRALEIQEDALADGYVISVDYDYNSETETYSIFCTTVIDGNIWYWYPDIDDISQDTSLLPVK
jgi:outer membrane murein-binding lipoprotein Lpp